MGNLSLTLKSFFLSAQGITIWEPFLVTIVICPLLIKLAPEFGLFDNPEGSERKIHGTIKPLGGPALALGLLPILLLYGENSIPLTLSALFVFFTGLIDDIKGLGARTKLIAQVAAVTFLIGFIPFSATSVYFSSSGGFTLSGPLNLVFVGFWLVGGINSFNLIDGLDGLSSGIAIISLLPLLVVSFGQPISLLLGGTIAGIAGILIYNFYPARLFLGDGGSYLVGFLTSYLVIKGLSQPTISSHTGWPLLAGIILLGLPVLDTMLAIRRRISSDRGVMEADQEHIHHKIHRSLGHLPAVISMYIIQSLLAALACYIYF